MQRSAEPRRHVTDLYTVLSSVTGTLHSIWSASPLLFVLLSLVSLSCSSDDEDPDEPTVMVSDFSTLMDENPAAGQSIGFIQASTNEGNPSFSILEQIPNNAFALNPLTGELIVLTDSLFDFETYPEILGIVEVQNGAARDTATVLILLNDLDDTNEITVEVSDFTVSMDENPSADQVIGTLEVISSQGDLSFTILEQSPAEAFQVGASTGMISVQTPILFNYEVYPVITGQVQVQNGPVSDTASITILLNDVIELSLQERLDNGEIPCEILDSDPTLLEQFYGLRYAGGLIFYLDMEECAGLVAAPVDQSVEAQWGCSGMYLTDAIDPSIGSGRPNTEAILAACTQPGIAAELCNDLVLDGYMDWYLPSKDELNLMYQNLHRLGYGDFENGETDCCNGWYWSSTDGETNGEVAWVQSFRSGQDGLQVTYDIGLKTFENHVRAVRSF